MEMLTGSTAHNQQYCQGPVCELCHHTETGEMPGDSILQHVQLNQPVFSVKFAAAGKLIHPPVPDNQ
jgi:hypothetical protein